MTGKYSTCFKTSLLSSKEIWFSHTTDLKISRRLEIFSSSYTYTFSFYFSHGSLRHTSNKYKLKQKFLNFQKYLKIAGI